LSLFGFLSGQITNPDDFAPDDFRRHNLRFQGENFQRNLALVERVRSMADEKGVGLRTRTSLCIVSYNTALRSATASTATRRWSFAAVSVPGTGVYTIMHRSGAWASWSGVDCSTKRPTTG